MWWGGSRQKEEPNIQTRKYYLDKYKRKEDWKLNDREFYDLVKRFNRYATNERMNLEQYRLMMGVLGETYLTERMFSAMDHDGDYAITLEEYLSYNDVISNGTTIEKREQNFRMLNDNKDSIVTYSEFEDFVLKILDMYSRSVSEKIDTNREMIREVFDRIAKRGKNEFTFEDYVKALEKDPDLFGWLERPKEMLNEILNQEEGKYSKHFVNDLIDILFKYITTTELAMKQWMDLVRVIKSNEQKAVQTHEETVDYSAIGGEIVNFLLDIGRSDNK